MATTTTPMMRGRTKPLARVQTYSTPLLIARAAQGRPVEWSRAGMEDGVARPPNLSIEARPRALNDVMRTKREFQALQRKVGNLQKH